VGGMAAPAIIFAVINHGSESQMGWGIPMATDIAFAAGCLALLGKRVPPALTIFLVALAIVDDLGSVLVIALFYSDAIHTVPLVIGILLILLSFALSRAGVRQTSVYAAIGILLWLAFLNSGVHATIAGIMLAFTIPSNARYETPIFFGRMTTLLKRFRDAEDFENPLLVNARQQSLIRAIDTECHYVEAPLQRIEHGLHPFALFVIMPIFAFANSGITLGGADIGGMLTSPVTLGVFFGLVAGKQVGIMLFAWLAVRLGLASLPAGVNWRHLYGVSWLAGVGFTMALFINGLAFSSADGEYLAQGKLGVLLASFTAGVVGCLVLWMAGKHKA
jgi:Na+:H+ antiporter, NhaA family